MAVPSDDNVTLADIGRDLVRIRRVLFGTAAVLFALEVLSWFLPIDSFGIRPRETVGLIGIVTMPLLHASFAHVFGNVVALMIFGAMIAFKQERDLYLSTLVTTLVGGAGVWLLARSGTNHIGASGVVFGLFGYLLSSGIFERKIGSILLSIFVFLAWGYMLFGVLPGQLGISWEGHLFGFLAGILSAWIAARWTRRAKARDAKARAGT